MRIAILFLLCFFLNASDLLDKGKVLDTQDQDYKKDTQVMLAALNEIEGNFVEASSIYLTLFESSKDYYFLKRASIMSFSGGDFKSAFENAIKYQEYTNNLDDIDINKVIAQIYLQEKRYDLAVLILEKINDKDKNIYNNFMMAGIYFKLNNLDNALKNYTLFLREDIDHPRERLESVIKIIQISEVKKSPSLVIPYIDEYIKGMDNEVSNISFISVYKRANMLNNLKNALEYRLKKDESSLNVTSLWDYFMETDNFKEAKKLIQKYKLVLGEEYKDLLLQTYMRLNDFKKALDLSDELYRDTNINKYLGLSAIYRYELLKDKNKNNLELIILDLKKSIINEEVLLQQRNEKLGLANAFFYNFLGYLLIDHDIDIQEGLRYASKAVAISPKTFEYLDSLAWGLYKLGECGRANETFKLIPSDYINSLQELRQHQKALNECISK